MTATPIPTCDYTLIVYTIVVHYMVLLTRYERGGGEADSIVAQVLTDCQGGNLSNNNCKAEGRWYIKEIEGGKVKEEAGGSPLSLHLQILTP